MATTVTPQDDLSLAPPKPKPVQPLNTTGQPIAGGPQAPQLSLAQGPTTQAPAAPTAQAPAPPVDRVALATQAFDSFAKARAPEAQKGIERVTSQAAGMGQLGSGQWRSALRDENAQQELTLATERDRLINSAIEGTIGDRQAADQLQLARELGTGNLDIAKTNADTSRIGTTGNLALGEKSLAQSGEQFSQSLALQAKAQEIDAAYKNGSLTLAQKDQALRELQNSQQLELAKTGQANQASQFDKSLAESAAGRQQQDAQFKASLAQSATQFGLSQSQQMALAKLSDATANRSIDASTAQGQNALLLELMRIVGGPTGKIDDKVLAALAKKFGLELPGQSDDPTTATTSSTTQKKDSTNETETEIDPNRQTEGG